MRLYAMMIPEYMNIQKNGQPPTLVVVDFVLCQVFDYSPFTRLAVPSVIFGLCQDGSQVFCKVSPVNTTEFSTLLFFYLYTLNSRILNNYTSCPHNDSTNVHIIYLVSTCLSVKNYKINLENSQLHDCNLFTMYLYFRTCIQKHYRECLSCVLI